MPKINTGIHCKLSLHTHLDCHDILSRNNITCFELKYEIFEMKIVKHRDLDLATLHSGI